MTEALSKTYQHWRVEKNPDGIVWLHIDKADSSTNVLSRPVLDELDTILGEFQVQRPRGVIIASGKANGFIAGADVNEFTTLGTSADGLRLVRHAQNVLDRLESLACPTIAMIHGFCLGGGLELALACRYRIADDDASTKIGLPEVRLGIHPGFGGTVRATRLVGALAAMDMMLTGRALNARAAKKIGLIDHAVPKRQLHYAATAMIKHPPTPFRLSGWRAWTNHKLVRPALAAMFRHQVRKHARPDHYPAPYAIIEVWAKYGDDAEIMQKEEAASVARLVMSDAAQSLIRVFMLQEQLKSLGKKGAFVPKHVHVIGGGVMGGDIAAWCAQCGLQVTLQDRKHETLAKVMKRARELYKKTLKQPRLVQAAMDRLIPDKDGAGLSRADVIIEAIFEDIDAKQALYREIESKIRPDALLATNTSSIPLDTLNKVLAQPERLVGLHFFNPVSKMQLVEIVKGEVTDAQVCRQAAAFARHIDRLPLPVASTPGFLVNRVLMPYLIEAVLLESEGVPASIIDKAALDFGMPMGPIDLADTVGLDICLSVAEILAKNFGSTIPERLQELVKAGRLGKKTGQGFYVYNGDKRVAPPVDKNYVAPSDLQDRLMLRMLNEAVACLREGVVENADLLDAGIVFGTGFAPFRGGPIRYIQKQGVEQFTRRLKDLEARYGARFAMDAGWVNLDPEHVHS